MRTKTFKQFLTEKKEYSYSSLQIELPDQLAKRILHWGDDHISDEIVFTDPDDPSFGREDNPHITLLYGIHESSPAPVEKLLSNVKEFEILLGKMSLFTTNDSFDVLKIEVESKELHKLQKKVSSNVDNTETYPKYIPHVTIAYLKKKQGQKFVGSTEFNEASFLVKEVVFSSKSGEKTKMKIGEK